MGKMEGKAGEGETRTYNFNLHGRGRVRAYVHAQTVVVRLVVGAVVREERVGVLQEGDSNYDEEGMLDDMWQRMTKQHEYERTNGRTNDPPGLRITECHLPSQWLTQK